MKERKEQRMPMQVERYPKNWKDIATKRQKGNGERMRAYQCDRCGEYFQNTIKGLPLYVTKNPSNYRALDLCPKCQKALEEWWKESKKGKKESEVQNG